MPANDLYNLSNGKPVTSLTPYSFPTDEYHAAFADRVSVFLKHYTFEDGRVTTRTLTRGEFWDMACGVAGYLERLKLSKGTRIVHGFSSNNVFDAVFRLAEVPVGCTTVTINWQADSDDTIIYKTRLAGARVLVYDTGFQARIAAIGSELKDVAIVNADDMGIGSANEVSSRSSTYDDERLIVFT